MAKKKITTKKDGDNHADQTEQETAITETEQSPIAVITPRNIDQYTTLNVDYSPPQIKLGKDSPEFTLPDGSLATCLPGHIVYMHGIRQYHNEQFRPTDPKPPLCSSSSKVSPDGGTNPMEVSNCAQCSLFRIGDTDANGYGCKERTIMLFLPDGDVVPNLINLPPTNLSTKIPNGIKKWLGTARALTAKAGLGSAYSMVHVELTLTLKEFSGGANSVLSIRSLGVVETQEQYDLLFDMWQEATNKSGELVSQVDLRGDVVEAVSPEDQSAVRHGEAPDGTYAGDDIPPGDLPF